MNNPFAYAGESARRYLDVRPGYPTAAIDAVLTTGQGDLATSRGFPPAALYEHGNLPVNSRDPIVTQGHLTIADIGAGTGKLTSTLVNHPSVKRAIAVEPSADMREAFRLALPEFPAEDLLGTAAEETGLPSNNFDVLTYAQSWHWLDEPKASAEAARLLKPGGTIALFFNQLDVAQPWVKRLTRIMRSGDVQRFAKPPTFGEAFTPPELTRCFWQDRLFPQEVMELGTTRSSWIKSTPANRLKMRENLRWYLYDQLGYADGNVVELPYHTFVWTATRR